MYAVASCVRMRRHARRCVHAACMHAYVRARPGSFAILRFSRCLGEVLGFAAKFFLCCTANFIFAVFFLLFLFIIATVGYAYACGRVRAHPGCINVRAGSGVRVHVRVCEGT